MQAVHRHPSQDEHIFTAATAETDRFDDSHLNPLCSDRQGENASRRLEGRGRHGCPAYNPSSNPSVKGRIEMSMAIFTPPTGPEASRNGVGSF